MVDISESKELTIYKKLLNVFGEYIEKFPCSGLNKVLDQALSAGKKCIPSDAAAKEILSYCLEQGTEAKSVQYLLNQTFDSLPENFKPVYKDGNKKVVALWKKENNISDRLKDLLNLAGEKSGSWSSITGEKVNLIEE